MHKNDAKDPKPCIRPSARPSSRPPDVSARRVPVFSFFPTTMMTKMGSKIRMDSEDALSVHAFVPEYTLV